MSSCCLEGVFGGRGYAQVELIGFIFVSSYSLEGFGGSWVVRVGRGGRGGPRGPLFVEIGEVGK